MKMKWLICAALVGSALLVGVMTSIPGAVSKESPGQAGLAKAIFAGGCFWCMEGPFDELEGVISTTSGYTGGTVENPTYEEVSAGRTGHTESVEVVYDPKKVTYERLLTTFWRNIDPTKADRQFCDVGTQYRPAIFYFTEEQRQLAEHSRKELSQHKRFPEPIVTEVTKATTFYPAEEYHQDFYQKNPLRYKFYRLGCGRDARLAELWGESSHG